VTSAALERQLRDGLNELDLDLPQQAEEHLLHYLALLQKWNRVYNLTAIREPSKLVSHHLLDSLAVLPHITGSSIADVGSGAGLPGIPLAIARPNCSVFLVESNHKKAAFLRQTIIELGLQSVTVVISRVEAWRPDPQVAIAISRAFSDLTGFIDAARHLVGPDGMLTAMKGIYPHEELAQMPSDVRVEAVVPLVVPGLRAARHLVLMRVAPS